jgi:hypothetical protein
MLKELKTSDESGPLAFTILDSAAEERLALVFVSVM